MPPGAGEVNFYPDFANYGPNFYQEFKMRFHFPLNANTKFLKTERLKFKMVTNNLL